MARTKIGHIQGLINKFYGWKVTLRGGNVNMIFENRSSSEVKVVTIEKLGLSILVPSLKFTV